MEVSNVLTVVWEMALPLENEHPALELLVDVYALWKKGWEDRQKRKWWPKFIASPPKWNVAGQPSIKSFF